MCNICMKALCKKCVRERQYGITCSPKCDKQLSKNRQSSGDFDGFVSETIDIANSTHSSYYALTVLLFVACGIGMLVLTFFSGPGRDIAIITAIIFFSLALITFFMWKKSKFPNLIHKSIRDSNSLEPLDINISLFNENPKNDLVAIRLYNDDKTTMDFIVNILEQYFNFNQEEAIKLMLKIHTQGDSIIQWVEPEAATKVIKQIESEASKRGYPFKIKIEYT
jgi:ATP-dependent Clp protease adaptor protein ClpS